MPWIGSDPRWVRRRVDHMSAQCPCLDLKATAFVGDSPALLGRERESYEVRKEMQASSNGRVHVPSTSARPTWNDTDRGERVNGQSVLIEGGPFDARRSVRLGLRRRKFRQFALKVDHIAGPYGVQPAQVVHAKPQQRVRPEGMRLDRKPHRYRGRVPARGGEPLQKRPLRCRVIEMIGLGIKLGCETLDVFAGHQLVGTPEAHAKTQIVEPL